MPDPSTWRDQGRLLDIYVHAERVQFYTRNRTLDDLEQDESLQLILRSLFTIIGEAASKLSDELKSQHRDVPWGKIAGLRHRIVHDYDKVNWERIWSIIQEDLPSLIATIRPMLPPEQDR